MDKKTSVLIVDDDPGMTKSLADILEDMGYEVAVAEDGYCAIQMIRERPFDVALMDIKMPGINGVETFREVKHISPSTRVMMMTAYSVEDLVREALDEGAYDVIYKPLDIDKVVEFVEGAERGALILVVDDDWRVCKTLRDVLEGKGYRVGVAHSGQEAIAFVKEDQFDIVFIDVKLPVLNGLEVFRRIMEVNSKITAIMMTGYQQEVEELVKEALKEDAYTCLYKPLEMEKVIALVEDICRQRRRRSG
jgi:DNA-binding NtrC family response regulator